MTLEQQLMRSIQQVKERKMRHTNGLAAGDAGTSPAAQDAILNQNGITRVMPAEMVRALYAPLPPEAIKPHPTKDYLSSVKAIFVIERLNEVFGMGGWTYRTRVIESDPSTAMVVIKVVLTIPAYGIRLEQYGGSDNKDRGDAYKGAVTDAISKIASYLGIAIDVYKGGGPTKVNPRGMAVAQPPAMSPAQAAVAQQKIASGNAATSRPWGNRGEMKRAFGIVREKVGEVAYLGELARYNVTPELNWRSAEQAIECYHHLAHLASKEVA